MIPLRVGIYFIELTRTKLRLPESLQELCLDNSIEFVVIDTNKNLAEQGPFDVILHKVLEWYNQGDVVGDAKVNKLLTYAKSNPDLRLVDSVEKTVELADRLRSMEILKECEFTLNGIEVFVPRFAFVEKADSENVMAIVNKHSLTFPLITKPPLTRFDAEAHDMAIIFSEHSVRDVMSPCVVQEFVNHGCKLYKIANADRSHYICERPSVKNLKAGCEPTVYFDSMTVSKVNIHNKDLHAVNPRFLEFRTFLEDEDKLDCVLDREVLVELLRRIVQYSGLSFFGVDIIIDEKTGNYGIIDLNYMPSYNGALDLFANDMYNKLKDIDVERTHRN